MLSVIVSVPESVAAPVVSKRPFSVAVKDSRLIVSVEFEFSDRVPTFSCSAKVRLGDVLLNVSAPERVTSLLIVTNPPKVLFKVKDFALFEALASQTMASLVELMVMSVTEPGTASSTQLSASDMLFDAPRLFQLTLAGAGVRPYLTCSSATTA